jgi:hypothetical protein
MLGGSKQRSPAQALKVSCSSLSDKLGPFAGQGGVTHDIETLSCLRRLEPLASQVMTVSMRAGRLKLKDGVER